MKLLIVMLVALSSAGAIAQYYPESEFAASCQNGDLITNRGRLLYQFSFRSKCLSALNQTRGNFGRFCDDENLVLETGVIAHRFNFRSECTPALNELKASRRNLFCDDSALYQLRIGQIADLTFQSTCREALLEAARYSGLFCVDGVMMNYLGETLRDYTFRSSCRIALATIGHALKPATF